MKTKKEIINFIERKFCYHIRYDTYLQRCCKTEKDIKEYIHLVFKDVRNNIKKECYEEIMNFIYGKGAF